VTGRISERPLCDAGRCGQLLALIAEREAGWADQAGRVIAEVIERVLTEVGVDPANVAVRASVARHIRSVTGLPPAP